MQSTRLILVSHAPTAATRRAAFPADEPLDAHGAADAALARERLDPSRLDTLLTGPELRCTQTAAALGLDATVDEGLRDADVGRWAGRTLDEVAAREPAAIAAWLGDPAGSPHGGEPLDTVLARSRDWLHALPADAGTVLAVTHPGVVRALVVAALTAGPAAFWRIDVTPLTRTVLRGGGTRWTLRETGTRLG